MQRISILVLSLILFVPLPAPIHGEELIDRLVGMNYRFDGHFEKAEIRDDEIAYHLNPCDPIIGNAGSLVYRNAFAEISLPLYRVIEVLNRREETRSSEYLYSKLQKEISFSLLPSAFTAPVYFAMRELILEGCFRAKIRVSEEPIQTYLHFNYSLGGKAGCFELGSCYATEDGILFFVTSLMNVMTTRSEEASEVLIEELVKEFDFPMTEDFKFPVLNQ